MKNSVRLIIFFSFLIFNYSCQHEEVAAPGKVTFSLSQIVSRNGRLEEPITPAFALLSIKDSKGNVQENIKLALYSLGQGYISDNLQLQPGSYQLTGFFILDAANKIIYAAPAEGSNLAKNVTDPLPIDFTVNKNATTKVVPQVLAVSSLDVPGDFGYANFGFDVVSNNPTVLIRAAVKIEIGGVLYENLDAYIRISGYDSKNALQWKKDYDFVGPYNSLEAKSGYHHYSIELVDKWGINDIQSDISGQAIWNERADGPHPTTYVLGGSKKAKKLSMTISTNAHVDNVSGGYVESVSSRDVYTYASDGRLQSISQQIYNPQTSQFEESSKKTFAYQGDATTSSKITTMLNGEVYSEYELLYGTPFEHKITLKENGMTWTQTAIRDSSSNTINASYVLSNGNSFSYGFNVGFKNIDNDKTVQAGAICNEGKYIYDKNINPLRHLGYIDFYFGNFSASNRLTEDVSYRACGFPSIVPVSYEYTYDQEGYPVKKITNYKTGSFDGENPPNAHSFKSEMNFIYQ